MKESGVVDLVLAERSGMGNTRTILQQMSVFDLSEKMGCNVVVLDETDKDRWVKIGGRYALAERIPSPKGRPRR